LSCCSLFSSLNFSAVFVLDQLLDPFSSSCLRRFYFLADLLLTVVFLSVSRVCSAAAASFLFLRGLIGFGACSKECAPAIRSAVASASYQLDFVRVFQSAPGVWPHLSLWSPPPFLLCQGGEHSPREPAGCQLGLRFLDPDSAAVLRVRG
jgi:hypothetical protein